MSLQLWIIESTLDMRYFHGESAKRSQQLYSEMKLRVKDEIPSEQIFFGQKIYKSHESIFGDIDASINYNFLTVDQIINTPIVRTDADDSVLLS